MNLSTKQLHARFQSDGTPCQDSPFGSGREWREALVVEYAPLIGRIVRKIAWCLPAKIEMADLMSAAWLGLLDAAVKFDPAKNSKFEAYARIRIQGAIRDELRTMDWVPRSVRKHLSEITRVVRRLEQERGRPAREEEVAEALNMRLNEYWRILEIARLIDLMQQGDFGGDAAGISPELAPLGANDPEADTLWSTEIKSLWEAIERALPELPPNQQTVLRLHYFEGKKLKEIGEVLGLSESRISQVRAKALKTLRFRFRRLLES